MPRETSARKTSSKASGTRKARAGAKAPDGAKARAGAKTRAAAAEHRAPSRGGAPRAFWTGSITFGLVHIPVALYTGELNKELSFKLLDRRDMTPVRYQRVNRDSGKEVPWSEVVRAYERSKGEFVVMTDEDLRRANVEAAQTVDILDFVDASEIEQAYFAKPYYVVPYQSKKKGVSAPRAYVLLREALRKTGKIGIGKVVLRTREHLCAVVPQDKALILNLMRFDHELRKEEDLDLPDKDLAASKAGDKELEMAERLISEMATKWEPERYKDEYHDDVLALIERKAKAGEALEIPEPEEAKEPATPATDIIAMLKKSLEGGAANRTQSEAKKKPGVQKPGPRKAGAKKGGGSRRAA